MNSHVFGLGQRAMRRGIPESRVQLGAPIWKIGTPALMTAALLIGCSGKVPDGALVLSERPANAPVKGPEASLLDERYPAGSRVVLATPPYRPADVRVLSKGLTAAGDIVMCPSGQRAVFAGKTDSGTWQIYEARLSGGRPRQITTIEGGAMNPAILGDGRIVFSSPVPRAGGLCTPGNAPALYAQTHTGQARRLTFGTTPAVEPTVLEDGRILFVSAQPPSKGCEATPNFALFTISNDGTELTTFALDHDGAPLVRRPRELPDGRIAFVAASHELPAEFRAEVVRKARPFVTRQPLEIVGSSRCTSISALPDETLLICADKRSIAGTSTSGSMAAFRMRSGGKTSEPPLFIDPGWDVVEATAVNVGVSPMGHISAISLSKKTGTILCLNANFTRPEPASGTPHLPGERVRVLTTGPSSEVRVLGEVALQADGSFMAEVPAQIPLGFETIDAQGKVLQRLPPSLWVQPGENRSCIGCHEPYNHSPRNLRPIAATLPPAEVTGQIKTAARSTP
jgi:hypothetical protein